MSAPNLGGRLSTLQAALVIARRDFTAILFSRSFFFFLLGPLFPVIVAVAASSVTEKTSEAAFRPTIEVAMDANDTAALLAARTRLEARLGSALPQLVTGEAPMPGRVIATGTLEHPVLSGPTGQLKALGGPLSVLAAEALGRGPNAYPPVETHAVAVPTGTDRAAQMRTAQGAQMLLFLLTMLLAGMVLSNMVEEKANKIIEVLAAAIPMDAVFFGKLFAMLAVSFVGIAVWSATIGLAFLVGSGGLGGFAAPAVGWPVFFALGIIYFAMAYCVLGSVYLTIGSMAATVREVQTLAMPASMSQLVTFFFASFAAARPGTTLAFVAEAIPFSSPFAMVARAATDASLWPHLVAIAWQAAWVVLFVRLGAQLFRRRVMKSGPAGIKPKRRRPFARAARA